MHLLTGIFLALLGITLIALVGCFPYRDYVRQGCYLPADVYDTLKASVVAHGVGYGKFTRSDGEHTYPFCIHGHARYAAPSVARSLAEENHLRDALDRAGISTGANDHAVAYAMRGTYVLTTSTISWERFVRALHVRRGAPLIAAFQR